MSTTSSGRHRDGQEAEGRGRTAAVVLTAAALFSGSTAAIVRTISTNPAGSAATSPSPGGAPSTSTVGQGTPAAAVSTLPACDATTTLAVPTTYVAAFHRLADDFARSQSSSCSSLAVTASTDTKAVVAGAAAGRTALVVARTAAEAESLPASALLAKPSVVATSPIVLAVPDAVARSLGWPGKPLSPTEWQGLLTGSTTTASIGHPEWGDLSIRFADPTTSGAGTAAYAAMTGLAQGKAEITAPNYAAPTQADLATIKIEHRARLVEDEATVLPYGATSLAQAIEPALGYVTTEKALADYNAETPAAPLSGVPLGAGTAVLDLRLATLGKTGTDAPGTKTASAFTTYLGSASGRRALQAAGLRPPDGEAPTDQPVGVVYSSAPLGPRVLTGPQLTAMAKMWAFLHARISTFALVDASGSMNNRFPGTTVSRIDLVRGLVNQAYSVASSGARSGVWFFRADDDGTPRIDRATGLATNGTVVGPGTQAQAVSTAMQTATISGGTPLYQAVREAYGYAQAHYDPSMLNQIVLLSDGANQDSTSKDTLNGLLDYLEKARDPERPVRIVAIGYGTGADMKALGAITKATGGKAAQVKAPADLVDAVNLALFSL